ncbi:maleylpyruvate isomerase family mycothiol-dependent enzyme [Mycobacterium sp. 94-17]|uniref:maleylpyruvate isomerase family mycothiol-dependent enzyme n=1 Tax=Mycobacterium sp. 94-17 TaxID=2986147 RepID=UPI002D1E9943|nr:maleylpyruvate isomerase family mycothiol-dependent enzyme [Mycobacterium sp. 94-17]MEB4210106.1 maleylpyruvate isomerase family mycothiol-dependent enzyme [Mycobacterium sp. 94-17]
MADRPVTKLDKSAVLSGLFAVWDDIDTLLAGLSEAQWRAASPLPGWDVKALVAHMIGTESFLAGIAAPQPDIDVSALEHVRNDIGVMNECWVRHLSTHADADVLESFRAITTDRREALTSLPGQEWEAVTITPAGPDSYGRFMRVRVFDCWMHEQDIRVALEEPPPDDELAGSAASLAVDEIAATMGYVVGKLAKAPDGSRVQFDLTGPLARTIRVGVDGRAAVVDDFGGDEPTVTIRLDGLQFTRLAGGRPMCPARDQDVELGGDKDVGTQIVEHLNFVI